MSSPLPSVANKIEKVRAVFSRAKMKIQQLRRQRFEIVEGYTKKIDQQRIDQLRKQL